MDGLTATASVNRLRAAGMVLALVCVHAALGVPASAATSHGAAQLMDDFLPGATTAVSSATPHAQRLRITLPPASFGNDLTRAQQQFFDNDLGWRAGIAASLIARPDQALQSWTLSEPDGSTPDPASDSFHGDTGVGDNVVDPALDTLSVDAARHQLEANLRILASVLPANAFVADRIQTYSAGQDDLSYALEADVVVNGVAALNGHFGDALSGLPTGLAGDSRDNPLEGLAIEVSSSDGTPIVGAWSRTRAAGGTLEFTDPTQASESLDATTRYADLTGGPTTKVDTLMSGSSAGSGRGHGPAATTARRVTAPTPRAVAWIVWAAVAVVAVTLVTAGAVRGPERRRREG